MQCINKTHTLSLIILFIIQFLFPYYIFSQEESFKVNIREVIPSSPQARTFQIYGNIPISHTTGVPDISIPLHTLISGNIKIPITLRYHTHSVKPFDANNSNVALGWVIDYGGAINRTVVGLPDERLRIVDPSKTFNENIQDDYLYLQASAGDPLYSSIDGQCDFFNYTLPTGEMAKFFLKRKNNTGSFNNQYEYFLYPNTESKIEGDIQSNSFNAFKITDIEGLVYEYGGNYKENYGPYTTGWMLNKITDQKTGKQVNFTYTSSIQNENSLGSFYSTLYDEKPKAKLFWGLDELVNMEGYMHDGLGGTCFHTSIYATNLEMCLGAKKIDCVIPDSDGGYQVMNIHTITNGIETVTFMSNGAITKITVTSGSVIIKEINLIIDKFSDAVAAKRLKSVTIKGKNGTPVETYSFEYTASGWANYSSDYWGFYTGAPSTMSKACTQKRELSYTKLQGSHGSGLGYLYDFDFDYNMNGIMGKTLIGTSDFMTNTQACTANLLTKIIYPTKGHSIFEYESGQYNSLGKIKYGGGPRIKSITDVSNIGSSQKRTFVYGQGQIMNDPDDINIYIDPVIKLHENPRYITKQTTIRNQPRWGTNIDVYYPTVDIIYESGVTNFKERYLYNCESEHKYNYIVKIDRIYQFVSEYFSNPVKGKLQQKIIYNSNNVPLVKENYSYNTTNRTVLNNLYVVSQVADLIGYQELQFIKTNIDYNFLPNPIHKYAYYKINIPNTRLVQKEITSYTLNDSITSIENYTYVSGSDVRIENSTKIQSDKNQVRTNYSYVTSASNSDMIQKNMINSIREMNQVKGVASKWIKNDYNTNGLLTKVSTYQGTSTPVYESRIDYLYDAKGNISFASKTGDMPVCYLWGYNYTYPVAKIEGISYSQLNDLLGGTLITSIGTCTDNSTMESYLNSVRVNLPVALITTYIYDHLLGVLLKMYDPSLRITEFTYDGFARLQSVKDHEGKLIDQYEYNYQN